MRVWVFFALLLTLSNPAYAEEPACNLKLAESLKNTAVSIERVLDADEMTDGSRGALGTAWFLSPTRLVTIGHMATKGKLTRSFKKVTLRWSDKRDGAYTHSFITEARIVEVVQTGMVEPLVILEIKDAMTWGQTAKIRKRPLVHGERVIGIGYKGSENTVILILDAGRVVAPNHAMRWDIPLQMNVTFTPGTSGSPIFDCSGEVVAVMQAMSWQKNFAVSAAPILFYIAPQ